MIARWYDSSVRDKLPSTVHYVKNGSGGCWWQAAKANKQIHAGWNGIPHGLLAQPHFAAIERWIRTQHGSKTGATQDFNQLHALLDRPSQHVWVTFEDRFLWWCTVVDGATVNPDGESKKKGNFWLACDRPWSNHSLKGKLLAMTDLPGTVTTVAGFKGTVCTPKAWEEILRIIHDEKDPDAASAALAREKYKEAVERVVKRLSPQDFEQLIDHVLTRRDGRAPPPWEGCSKGLTLKRKIGPQMRSRSCRSRVLPRRASWTVTSGSSTASDSGTTG